MPMRKLASLLLIVTLTACASHAAREDAKAAEAVEVPELKPANDGGIYAVNSGLTLFEDQKAHRVGDLLTVLLVESTNAQKKADTSASKKDASSISAPTVFGHLFSYATELGADRAFAGSGASSQSNTLSGSVTVTVTRVLANGNLIVRGEKNLNLNQGNEKVALEGVVRAIDVSPTNTVTSDRVANARISYSGSGAVADANSQGWLSRFFSSVLFPF